ncbi:MAG: hypothetical protein M1829_005929 [Trizodia sp. TS-e1964]|nr:MAG: hypothetical protein M1829_005929 [Trizodia sp. TS-e1964]
MDSSSGLTCPFCEFVDNDSYFLTLHVETLHSETGNSPFIVRDFGDVDKPPAVPEKVALDAPAPQGLEETPDQVAASEDYINCPEDDCGEELLFADLSMHMDLHLAEQLTFNEFRDQAEGSDRHCKKAKHSHISAHSPPSYSGPDTNLTTDLPSALKNYDESLERPTFAENLKQFFLGPSSYWNGKGKLPGAIPLRRLGKAELGPHADENQMPAWLRRQLEDGGEVTVRNEIDTDGTLKKVVSISNEATGILPVIAKLCQQDGSVEQAFLCHPAVKHVVKQRREGGFCGYRNIQMLISYIQATSSQGHEHFPGRLPNILQLQDLIESAWDRGIMSTARIETGGIRGTRKYIGTPEAQALFISLDIDCQANGFSKTEEIRAHHKLLPLVEEYFAGSCVEMPEKVHRTDLPPLYFQHAGHSLTIIGIERRKDGSRNLLVFDPMFKSSPAVRRLIGVNFRHNYPEDLLKAYRRGERYLRRYNAFELLRLTPPPKTLPFVSPEYGQESGMDG